jgi:hypothetical protein
MAQIDICPANIALTCNRASTDEELLELLGGNPVTATYINKQVISTSKSLGRLIYHCNW